MCLVECDIEDLRLVVSTNRAKEGDNVLDVCCGSGDLAFLLSERVGVNGKVCIMCLTVSFVLLLVSIVNLKNCTWHLNNIHEVSMLVEFRFSLV